eukprot:TRINITY_DN23300_c0_g1_i1.p1 TRINITY_DN23300_c0_g1~~TRINITY_DN23300_c0_g1_i1.p1  ORF type:complete len:268 (+),score=71.13 TRINITY_DN23300_c0_g1_i1:48-851(+)
MEAAQERRRKRREEREREKHAEKLIAENEALREQVDKITGTGEDHRQKVETLFMDVQREKEELEDDLERLTSGQVVLFQEVAESGGQLNVTRMVCDELRQECESIESELTNNTTQLSAIMSRLVMCNADEVRIENTCDNLKRDLMVFGSDNEKLQSQLSLETIKLEETKKLLQEAQRKHEAAQSQQQVLQLSRRTADTNRAKLSEAVSHLNGLIEEVQTTCTNLQAGVMPSLIPKSLILPSERHIPEEEAKEKRQAYERAEALKRTS